MIDSILHWNAIAIETARRDFETADPKVSPSPEQGGPTRTSRALAIVHAAMFDAYTRVRNGAAAATYLGYAPGEVAGTTDLQAAQAAVSAAASLTLGALFSRQEARLKQEHLDFVADLNDSDPKIGQGIAFGTLVASKMLALRANDGSDASDAFYAPSPEPGRHRVDPLNPNQAFLGPLWGQVAPFGINNLNTAVPSTPPPSLNSPQYAADYNEVLHKGRDSGGTRTPDETTIGLFWAYDGARNIGVPPRLYNQVVRAIAAKKGTSETQNAKLFAMVNIAMADAGIQAWYEKYLFNYWRPVIGIREAGAGFGPTGQGDQNPATAGDPYWSPLGAPRTNQPDAIAFTPHFPAYPSGHATFGTAAIRVAALFLGLPDNFAFDLVSEELDGKSVGATGVRVHHRRRLTIASAINENVLSRVYLGVHWQFDGREGEKNGNLIAQKIVAAFPAMA
jgi:hypothetical protein